MTSLTHVWVVVDHTLYTQWQRSPKLILTLISLVSVFSLLSLHLLSKTSFCCTFCTHSRLFNEMFIFSGKSRCYNGTFVTYNAASKEYLNRLQISFRCLESTFHQLCHLKVLFRVINSSKSCARKWKGLFFMKQGVNHTSNPENVTFGLCNIQQFICNNFW